MRNCPLYVFLPILLIPLLFQGCAATRSIESFEGESFKIQRLARHSYNHISFLDTETYGKVPCNGLIFVDHGEAILFDTPPTEAATTELLDWIEQVLKCQVKAVVVTHFHVDCLGGLAVCHEKGIPSYGQAQTLQLAVAAGFIPPEQGFESKLELKIGRKLVFAEFPGPGHTQDNIVGYIPSEQVLFGGCLVKAMGAGKGNLEDANVNEWSNTVRRVKALYGQAKVVIPGHGKSGGSELLDYTIEKFEE